jgi:sialate O-acetylesterase
MTQTRLILPVTLLFLLVAPAVRAADVTFALAVPLGDNAILQQQTRVPVWGTAAPGSKVTVTFGAQSKSTEADAAGQWRVSLDPMPADKLASVAEAPAGRTLTAVADSNGTKVEKSIKNLLVGEVWLCSGQSNMAGKYRMSPYPPKSDPEFPALRMMAPGEWVSASAQTAGNFSRVAFSFARDTQAREMVPVGLLIAATGGSSIEAWTPAPEGTPIPEKGAGSNYQAHIKPLVGYALRGALWYQGEANARDGEAYLAKQKLLIDSWRAAWGQGDFPFYLVQLAGIGEPQKDNPAMGDGRAKIRQAQFEVLSTVKNTGMAVTLDISAPREHPINKHDVGLRLARWAAHREYGHKDLVPSGPLYKSFAVEGQKVRIKFDYAQNGLMLAEKKGYEPPTPTPDATIPWLSIQNKDGAWHWAQGVIDGSDLIVSSAEVKNPIAVRYAYTGYPLGCNLYNKEGLPAGPFSTCGY